MYPSDKAMDGEGHSTRLFSARKYLSNPPVGAIVADEKGVILAQGAHRNCGQDHAEVIALSQCADKDLSKATLYITLEPCSTKGYTAPCTDRISNRV